ncbi:hypothetical protein [Halobacillus mangrovi]|uniref:hypothetical protein n=1 Tax=Halobacillus mangrovi TaxID=402384 RepID=UPI003D98BB1C
MNNFQVGQLIQKRCTSCYNNQVTVLKVDQKDFNEKSAFFIWTQCPECGMNHSELMPEKVKVNDKRSTS